MKKFLALIMVVAMVVSLSSVVFAKYDEKGAIAHYTFDGNAADKGLTVKGDNMKFADGKAEFGEKSWLESDVNLNGLTEITVAVKLKVPTDFTRDPAYPDKVASRWIFEITSQAQHFYHANEKGHEGEGEHYLAAYFNGQSDWIDAQAHGGADEGKGYNGRPGHANAELAKLIENFNKDEYLDMVVVYTANSHLKLYVNGTLALDDEVKTDNVKDSYALTDIIGSNPTLKLGKANWDDGEYANTLSIDDVVIYNYALNDEEVKDAFTVEKIVAPSADDPTPDTGSTGTGTGGQGGQGGAPATGFATVAIALVAVGSGAYIVSKKRH